MKTQQAQAAVDSKPAAQPAGPSSIVIVTARALMAGETPRDDSRIREQAGDPGGNEGDPFPGTEITLAKIGAVIQQEPPVGAEMADACGYDPIVLARRCGVSLRRLEQVFKPCHLSPYRWMQHQRLVQDLFALNRLQLMGRLESLKRFAFERGYPSFSQFDRAFQQMFHMKPGEHLRAREGALQQLRIRVPAWRDRCQPAPGQQ